jgi:hypothetical protein
MDIFGFEITRKKDELRAAEVKNAKSFVPQVDDDGTPVVSQNAGYIAGGAYGAYVDMEGGIKNEVELIRRYRETSLVPECDAAIEDIVNECITSDSADRIVTLDLRDVKLSDSIKNKMQDEFYAILSMMKFNQNSHEIFRKWYVDGRIYFHKVVDGNRTKQGLVDIRQVDPLKIKKVRNVETKKDKGVEIISKIEEFYVFNDKGFDKTGVNEGTTVKIAPEAVCYTTSGLLDFNKNAVIGYLHKALKTANQLSMMEDALVIYRLSRAPERRIFYIDVGNLPKAKAEQYLADVMNKYRNKLVYNADTGEIKDDRKHMSMLEDFWLPRREGGRGTEITTLPGGQNLAEIDDVEYFKKKLYQSLNVPSSRMEADNGFNMGRSSEISRDELKFNKFTNRLQKKFARVFTDLLRTQLVLKEVLNAEEFDKFKDFLQYDFTADNHFTELKEQEIFKERLDALQTAQEYVGQYFSKEYVRKYILRQTEEDIKIIDDQIEDEKSDGDSGDNDGFYDSNEIGDNK